MSVDSERAAPTVAGISTPASRAAQVVADILQFLIACAIGALAAYAVWTQLPEELDVRTDIVGYPIHSDFNIYRYFWIYWLIAGFFPLVTFAIFLVLRRALPRARTRRVQGPRRLAVEPPLVPARGGELVAVASVRVAFVGAIFGLETALALSWSSGWIPSVGLPFVVGYAFVATLGALLLRRVVRFPTTFWERLALANAVALTLSVPGLYLVAKSTEITVASTGRVIEYVWFPSWLAAGLASALIGWVLTVAFRAQHGADFIALERRLLLTVAGPIVILLFLVALPGALGVIELYEEGEALASAREMGEGAFPWRDFVFIHGFLADVVYPWVGFTLFDDSRWGYLAGFVMVIVPLYWISVYYLFAYLFRRNWLFLVGTQLALILGVVYEGHIRFTLLPFVLLLLAGLLSKPTRMRAAAFMSTLVVQTIVSPEAALATVAVLVTVVAFEAYYFDRAKPLRENFRRTLWCIATGTLLTAVWLVLLAGFGAFDDFVMINLMFASDHELTGGLRTSWVDERFRFAAVTPVVLVVLAFFYFAFHMLLRRPLSVPDWVMGASAIFVGLFYHKYLARADEHVYQSFAVAVPLLYYVVYRLISLGDEVVARARVRLQLRVPIRLGVTAVAVGILLVQAPVSLADVIRNVPGRLDATVARNAKVPKAGFTEPVGLYTGLVRDLDVILDTFLDPQDAVFDFTNSPGLFHYLIDRQSPTRYLHVSLAIRSDTQDDLVQELAQNRPKIVVFSSSGTGLPSWDGIANQVRHYRVSDYLLSHYRPLFRWNGFVFWGLRGIDFPPASILAGRIGDAVETKNLHFRGQPCDWGYAPNFLVEGPRLSARPLRLATRELGALVSVAGWAIDPEAQTAASKVVAAIGGRVVAQNTPADYRPDIEAHLQNAAYRHSGFTLGVRLPSAMEVRSLRIYAVSRSGTATELAYAPSAAWGLGRPPGPRELRIGQRKIRVLRGRTDGFADSSTVSAQLLRLDVPPSIRGADYRWLEVRSRSPLLRNGFMLSDRTSDLARGIFFRTVGRGEYAVRVYVGACSQWHGYRARRLYLRIDRRQAIEAVRLYR